MAAKRVLSPEEASCRMRGEAMPKLPDPTTNATVAPLSVGAFLEEQIRLLREEVNRASAAGETVSYQRASRALIQALQIYQKNKDSEEDDGIKVSPKDIEDAAFRARQAVGDLYSRIVLEREEWSVCPHCGQKMKPGGSNG